MLIQTRRPARHPIAVAASLLCTFAAQAQNAPVGPSTQPATENQTVQNIVVTAQKREQAAIDVPASVSTVNADRLQRSGAVRLEDYAAQMPGMSVTAVSRGFSSVVLRGISTGISQPTPGTAFYIDEAPIGSITAYATGSTLTPDLDPYDLRRIEVLKGPQGTLYGAGAVGGLLRYVTQPADTQRLGGAVSIGGHKISEGGSGYEARASINVPLVDQKLGLRVSLLDRDDAGYIDNPQRGLKDVNQATTRGGRVALDWKITPDWSLQSWAMTQRFRTDGIGIQDLNYDSTAKSLTPTTGDLEHSSAVPEKQGTNFDVFNATLKGHVGDFDLVSSTTYQKLRGDVTIDYSRLLGAVFSPLLGPLVGSDIGGRVRQIVDTKRWSQELRARSTAFGDKLGYEVGLILNKEDSTNQFAQEGLLLVPSLAPLPALPGPLAAFNAPLFNALLGVNYKDYSLFGNATYSLTPQLDLTAGLRYSHVDQHFRQNYQPSLLLPVASVFEEDVTIEKTTYLLSAIYKVDARTAIYGRIATGFRSGGPSALPPSIGNPTFNPDTLTSYEIGYKAALAGGTASIEAALFRTDWKDVVVQRGTVSGGVTYQHFVNAGDAKVQGAEATLLLFPMQGLTLRTTGAYTDSRLTTDAPSAGGLSGDRMPFVPKWTASLAADYRFPIAGHSAWVGGVVGYIGQRRSDFSQVPDVLDVPSYTTLGLNAGVEFGNVRVSVYGKNLTDERGLNHANALGTASPGNPVGNPIGAGTIQPRTIGIDLAYRF
ncbi:MAG: TonB-dependent receptor [Pseudomonadota bacterium]